MRTFLNMIGVLQHPCWSGRVVKGLDLGILLLIIYITIDKWHKQHQTRYQRLRQWGSHSLREMFAAEGSGMPGAPSKPYHLEICVWRCKVPWLMMCFPEVWFFGQKFNNQQLMKPNIKFWKHQSWLFNIKFSQWPEMHGDISLEKIRIQQRVTRQNQETVI